MEKGGIISLVGKNCPRDIHWGPVTWLQSRSREFEPMHSRIFFKEIGYKIISAATLCLPPILVGQFRLTLEYYECRCCNKYQSQQPKIPILCIHMTRNTQIFTYVNVNVNLLLHLFRPRCIFTRVHIYSGMFSRSHVCKIYIYVKFTYVCKSAHVNCTYMYWHTYYMCFFLQMMCLGICKTVLLSMVAALWMYLLLFKSR